ncbi:MAG TPA: alpha-hydroxy acid oxidase [Bryobacteraceae bacterium]|jgi:isopentenyl diphosphate isomerase/L-lactate dehydrogenase-like FMN-dependent dehydrogenase
MEHRSSARREFLRFLAASPLLGAAMGQEAAPIASPKDALDVLDFEALARKALPPAHWGYMSTGVDDDLTIRANRDAMTHYQLRARRLVGAAKPDLSIEVFGSTWDLPIYFSAVSAQRAFHPEGELATARAAKARKVTQMLSTVSSTSVEDVAEALGKAPWYQLYMPTTWEETEKLVRRVEAAGCQMLAWTIDTLGGRNAETGARLARLDTRNCSLCHKTAPTVNQGNSRNLSKPMFKGLSGEMNPAWADWSYVDRLKKMTKMKVVLKGIDTGEDAVLAREHGADGVVVSNHGGRATETGRGTMDILPEVVDAVGPQFPVFVDGGFRRGTDVFKALSLGARAVGIGRPYVWGLAAFGQEGVERVIELLRAELVMTMRNCGVPAVNKFTRASVLHNGSRM